MEGFRYIPIHNIIRIGYAKISVESNNNLVIAELYRVSVKLVPILVPMEEAATFSERDCTQACERVTRSFVNSGPQWNWERQELHMTQEQTIGWGLRQHSSFLNNL